MPEELEPHKTFRGDHPTTTGVPRLQWPSIVAQPAGIVTGYNQAGGQGSVIEHV
ncbi:hypothetical protein ACFVOR_25135 [Streptomyces sp. NPDC057837]|uniref:hypothetical protein n=1 Tax=Streptomyces sp. NPDC057837 TaxID=3346260 RepID=UPI00368CBEA4